MRFMKNKFKLLKGSNNTINKVKLSKNNSEASTDEVLLEYSG